VIQTTQDFNQYRWGEYSAETGTKINEARAPGMVTSRTMQVHWAQYKGHHAGLGILDRFEGILYGKEIVCSIPNELRLSEQAKIGNTHLVIMSSTYGVIIMKAPQDVDSFGADYTTPENDGCSTGYISSPSHSDSGLNL